VWTVLVPSFFFYVREFFDAVERLVQITVLEFESCGCGENDGKLVQRFKDMLPSERSVCKTVMPGITTRELLEGQPLA